MKEESILDRSSEALLGRLDHVRKAQERERKVVIRAIYSIERRAMIIAELETILSSRGVKL